MTERSLYTDLAWLPVPPADFNARCARLMDHADPPREIRSLAAHALDENQLNRLAGAIALARSNGLSLAPLTPFRLGIIGSGTLDFVVPALISSAARHGVALEWVKGQYDQFLQEAVSASSTISTADCDAVLIAVDYRSLPLDTPPADAEAGREAVAAAFDILAAVRAGISSNAGAVSIVQTFAAPPETLLGSFDRILPGSPRFALDALNRKLAASIAGTQDILLDVAALAETVGLAKWYSPSQWNMAKLPFSSTFIPLYAEHVARILAALRGKSRRCLVLDLDNTLWGGVVGDDGVEGIKVAQGDAVGEAYLAVQRLALALRARGIILAVSSKNSDETARLPFQQHPDMLLRQDHFAVFQANWSDKASNIEAIAEELSLGLESLVFLDDNPAERGLVRQTLPDVAVPELPEDPALFARTLAAAGYFEAVAFSSEDLRRVSFYEDNARRVALRGQGTDIDAYLALLDMQIAFQPFDEIGRARITQLINKSNQFNLTTRRYTEAEVVAVASDPGCFTLQVKLADRFGDNGMISVVVCRPVRLDSGKERCWEIDTWLMSCRVLGRKVEEMVLAEVLRHARSAGIGHLLGIYRPSNRNGMVRDHYQKLGFTRIGERGEVTEWLLATDTVVVEPAMTVRRAGFDIQADRHPGVTADLVGALACKA
jgi:FkbH-like protein